MDTKSISSNEIFSLSKHYLIALEENRRIFLLNLSSKAADLSSPFTTNAAPEPNKYGDIPKIFIILLPYNIITFACLQKTD